jgi:acetylornithine/N-succinyldiaminopimelate aminotransferase
MENVLWEIGHELKIKDITHADGCFIYDAAGNKYADLESGVWCTPLGHCHPEVNAALAGQMAKILHTGYCYAHPVTQKAARMVLDICGMDDGKCLFLTSGSEAVEVGVKAMQMVSDKPKLLTFTDSFLGSLGSSGKKPDKEWFLFDRSPCEQCARPEPCARQCPYFAQIPFESIAGFVLEPGSASGMVRFPQDKLVTAIADAVHGTGGFVQVNEITTGIGRTGEWFGFQHYDIQPDIVSTGKGIGNGYPVSATAFNTAVLDAMMKNGFYHHQSHQNDPLGCAVVCSVIDTLRREGLIEKTREKGHCFRSAIRELAGRYPEIEEVRGRGLMMALDFSKTLAHDTVVKIHNRLIRQGYITVKRPDINTIRIDPPLIVTRDILDGFVRELGEILKAV